EYGGSDGINNAKRVERSFNSKNFKNKLLKDALKIPEFDSYIKNLTGLKQPGILVEIGEYFNKYFSAYVWISSSKNVRAVWLGCYYDLFSIVTYDNLSDDYAARGVRSL
ncbi:MAG: hypothetical protein V1914_04740, partial [archaeon]